MSQTRDPTPENVIELARYIRDGAGSGGMEEAARLAEEQLARLKELELLYVADEGHAAISPAAREMFFENVGLLRRLGGTR
ncbi:MULTISPECIES: hypothetical protein [Methylocystis]|uniref:Uncharacterized protein n=1 Tax=Methylocystis iwaonis TaxID=2885079 RepID=A0ABN6V9E0_9HYPH|nr:MULTISPECIES: hypothetical protein [Methylocystis]MBL1255544.1 hypothetical protein [Methylocystis sp. Sn-Cys]BDV32616.1 hypothetical protein SS37A_01450 [Methylocystis iwaonis]